MDKLTTTKLMIPYSYDGVVDPCDYFAELDNLYYLTECLTGSKKFNKYIHDIWVVYCSKWKKGNLLANKRLLLHEMNKEFIGDNYSVVKSVADKEMVNADGIVRFDNIALKAYTYGVNGELEGYRMLQRTPKTPMDFNVKKINNPVIALSKPIRCNVIREDNFDSTINKKKDSGAQLRKRLEERYNIK
jgi:hypothetical protein